MKNDKKPIGQIYYDVINEDEYNVYRISKYDDDGNPVYINIEDEELTPLTSLPEDAIELIPISTVKFITAAGLYYFVFEYESIGDESKKETTLYPCWSIQAPIDSKKETKFVKDLVGKTFALYIPDNQKYLRMIGIENDNISYNLISLFHSDTGIYETKRKNLILDEDATMGLIKDVSEYIYSDIVRYGIFEYEFSIDLSKISQDYIIIQNTDKTYIMTYSSVPKRLDPVVDKDAPALKGITTFMNKLRLKAAKESLSKDELVI